MSDYTITDWFKVSPAVLCEKIHTTIGVTYPGSAAFAQGTPAIIHQFNYTAAGSFSIIVPVTQPTRNNYTICFKYRIGNTVYRYRVYGTETNIANSVAYAGQIIKPNFCIEFWNNTIADDNGSALDAVSLVFVSSILNTPGDLRSHANVSGPSGTAITIESFSAVTIWPIDTVSTAWLDNA